MNVEIDSLNAAIDDAARALVTPPPDEGFIVRVVSLLPERVGDAHRLWWVPAATVAALVAWLALGPGLELPRWSGLDPSPEDARRSFKGTAGTSIPATFAGVLVATDTWQMLAPARASVAPSSPLMRMRSREDVRVRIPGHVTDGEAWGLRPIEPPSALVVTGLTSTDPPRTEVAPLAVAALPLPAALHDMKE